MKIAFAIIAALIVVSAVGAVSLRKIVHCALCLAVAFAGFAAIYLQLDAAFLGWAQVLVYIGAVAVLIIFAILLTRNAEHTPEINLSKSRIIGVVIAMAVFAILTVAIIQSPISHTAPPVKPEMTVRELGNQLMTRYVLPLEVIGLLLTATAIGAVIIALKDSTEAPATKPPLSS